MSNAGNQTENSMNEKERKPVVLSKNEALYPPSKKAVIATAAAMIIGAILVILFVLIPLWTQ